MRVILMYLVFAVAVYGIAYGLPSLRKTIGVANMRRLAIALSVPVFIMTVIYLLEETGL